MASFDRSNNGIFQKDSSIYSIFYGTNAALLEDELNESQWTQIERVASIMRDQYSNGFLKGFTVNTTEYDNIFYIEGTSPFSLLIDGYSLKIGGNTVVSQPVGLVSTDNRLIFKLPAADTSPRWDLVFLEVWFESLNSGDTIHKFGGVNTPTIQNNMLDARIAQETSRRIQLRWRIRTSTGTTDLTSITACKLDGTDSGVTFNLQGDIYVSDIGIQRDSYDNVKSPGIVYAIPLFEVNRPANVNTISPANITNLAPKVKIALLSAGGGTTIEGDATIKGALNLEGQLILNSDATGAPTENVGIVVERGDSSNVSIRWNESNDKWELTSNGSTFSEIINSSYLTTIGGASNVGKIITVNAGGKLDTSITGTSTGAPFSGISGLPTTLAGYGITDAVNTSGSTMTGFLTLHADPTEPLHAATKAYVDGVKQGLTIKDAVRAATTVNITLSGLQTVDGVVLNAGDRVLVKNQTDGTQNGLYNASTGAWTRTADADNSSGTEVASGMYVFVAEGSTQKDSGWSLTTNNPITLGVTSLSFTQFSGAGQIIAGTGITKSGNTLSHSDTSTLANTVNTGRTYIQNLSFDDFGHVTAITTATETVALDYKVKVDSAATADFIGANYNDGAIRIDNAGLAWTDGGNFITISHKDTSTQASVSNTGFTFIQGVTLDTYGHITALSSATIGTATTGANGLMASGDKAKLDKLQNTLGNNMKIDGVINVQAVEIQSTSLSTSKYVIEYNETEDSLDFVRIT